ncbi:MAG: metal-sensitive transcriptional regulator [Patescibacteria group bacterium]|nr:MAG: metal-sensitive transcriptional regulator [Patescibacteria group bacterium]
MSKKKTLLTPKTKKEILNRMSYLIGHLKGISKMIEREEYCIDLIHQNQGVIAALEKVNGILLRSHLDHCVREAAESRDSRTRRKVFSEIVEVFRKRG